MDHLRFAIAVFLIGLTTVVLTTTAIEAVYSTPACSSADVVQTIIARERPGMGPIERQFWFDALTIAARKNHVPVDIFAAKIAQESKFRAGAVSNRGAKGAGQLMPIWTKGFDPFEIEANLDKSAEVLAGELKTTNGDVYRALRRYNGGPGGEKLTATQIYANEVLSRVLLAERAACRVTK